METLTVACVEVGDFLGRGHEYVRKLANMCKRHLPEHRFVALSDECHMEPGIDTIVEDGLPVSFWAKVHLFKPGYFTGDVIYFDLDTVISRDLTELVALLERGDFFALDDFAWPLARAHEWEHAERQGMLPLGLDSLKVQLGGFGTVNSSVMLWRGDAGRDIWDQYTPEAIAGLDGDQNHVTKVMGSRINIIPKGFAGSYRYGPEGCPITIYHGIPKPHEIPHDLVVKEHWR